MFPAEIIYTADLFHDEFFGVSGRLYRLLLAVGAALGQAGLTTGGLAQNSGAGAAGDHGLSMRKDGGDGQAALALNIHKITAGSSNELLQLVLLSLRLRSGVKQVNSKNHCIC